LKVSLLTEDNHIQSCSDGTGQIILKKVLFSAFLKLNIPDLLLKQSIKSKRKVYLAGNRYKSPTKAEINHFMIILNILGLDPLSSIILPAFLARL
jgi:hypothetical protein